MKPARTTLPHYAGAVVLVGFVIYLALYQLTTHAGWSGVAAYRGLFWQGWLGTLGLASGALVLSVAFGFLLALGRRATWLPVRALCSVQVACSI